MTLLNRGIVALVLATYAVAAEKRQSTVDKRQAPTEGDYADRSSDGSYAFRYGDRNQFHSVAANKDNVVSGRYGSRSPETGRIVQTSYSAGPRGFRARGPDVARQTDLSQVRLPYSPPVPTDSSKYDPAYDRYHDPNEDPSYKFTVRTPTQLKAEESDSRGHIEGVYSYLDDVGKRHDVQYEAGAETGFHVKSPHPDSDSFGGVFYNGPPGAPGGRPRGHSSVVLGKDGSYGFTAAGPDQRRTEVSDANGRVRGSYTYVDDKGVQRTVQYVAGPEIGYRVVNNAAAGGASVAAVSVPSLLQPPLPSVVPPGLLIATASPSPLAPAEFEQDLFGPAASSTFAPAATGSSTFTPPLLDPNRRREPPVKSSGGSGISGGSLDFLSPDSAVPLGSAFPEDDPALPPKKWPTAYKNKDEQSFFEAFDKRRREQSANKSQQQQFGVAVPDTPYGNGGGGSRPSRPELADDTAAAPPSYSQQQQQFGYGRPSPRPIVVPDDDKYGQYGGTDYQKPSSAPLSVKNHHAAVGYGNADDSTGTGFDGFPHGTVVKAHVQSLDILPFGYRVPSPSYVLEKQFGDDYSRDNAIKK